MDEQPELFEIPPQAPPSRRGVTAIGRFQIRQDHAVLMMVAGLIGLSVVFAFGVERGKQLVRAERSLLDAQVTIPRAAPATQAAPHVTGQPPSATGSPSGVSARHPLAGPPAPQHSGRAGRPAPSAPTKPIGGRSRFAVQVVSYNQLKLAHRELQRLQQRGERAFLVMKQGKVALLVGPFASKANAHAKLASLKQRYQGCFIRSL